MPGEGDHELRNLTIEEEESSSGGSVVFMLCFEVVFQVAKVNCVVV